MNIDCASVNSRARDSVVAGGVARRVDVALEGRLAIGCNPAFSGCFTANGVLAFIAPLPHGRGSLLLFIAKSRLALRSLEPSFSNVDLANQR